jgi:hypothetical protein
MKKHIASMSAVAAFALVGLMERPASASTLRTSTALTTTTAAAAQGGWRQNYDYAWEDEVIRDAFRDIVRRQPNRAELRHFRMLMVDEGWNEWEVRQEIRDQARSGRFSRQGEETYGRQATDADSIIHRAYRDILGREPDAGGLREYRNRIRDDGWSEAQVRQALRSSPEYRERGGGGTMTRERAQEIVRQAYLSVLRREPDPASAGFVDRVFRDHWTLQDVERELRNSAEYRDRRR